MWRGALAGLLLILVGCDGVSFSAPSASYYVLIDTSVSYYQTRDSQFSHTKHAIRSSQQLVNILQPGDRFTIAEIQSCSFNDDAELIDESMPELERDLFPRRQPLRDRLNQLEQSVVASERTDIQGAILGATLAMQSSQAPRRFLIIFSDLVEDRSPDCVAPPDEEIDLSGIDVLFVEVKRLAEDQRNPAGYLSRRQYWVDWAISHDARSADILNDAAALEVRLQELHLNDRPPPQRLRRRVTALPPDTASPQTPVRQEPSPTETAPPAAIQIPGLPEETVPPQSPINPPAAVAGPTQAAIPPFVSQPVWLERPDARTLSGLYPPSALRADLEGEAILRCVVEIGGRLRCVVVGERPSNRGFGQAALRIAGLHRMAERDREGFPTTGRAYQFTVPFRVE